MFVRTSDTSGTAKALRAEISRLDPYRSSSMSRQMTDAVAVALVPARLGASAHERLWCARHAPGDDGHLRSRRVQRRERTRELGIRKAVGASSPSTSFGSLMSGNDDSRRRSGIAVGLSLGVLGARGARQLHRRRLAGSTR